MSNVCFKTDLGGRLQSLQLQNREVPLRADAFGGPSFVLSANRTEETIVLQQNPEQADCYCAARHGLEFGLQYIVEGESLCIDVSVKNIAKSTFKPTTLGVRLGIDCYMEKYPNWYHNPFPTLLRCEKTHFWGYCMTPAGQIIGVACPDPLAAWSLDYNTWVEDASMEEINPYLTGGHRIYSFVLMLLCRSTKHGRIDRCEDIKPGETLRRRIYLKDISDIEQIPDVLSSLCGAAYIKANNYTVQKGEACHGTVYGACTGLTLHRPNGQQGAVALESDGQFCLDEMQEVGLYRLQAVSPEGKVSEAFFYLRHSNGWYLQNSRKELLKRPPVYTHHMESFNCFHSAFGAQQHFPDEARDRQCNEYFEAFFKSFYDFETNTAREAAAFRIQDSASMSLLCAYYSKLTGKKEYMYYAESLADFIVSCQAGDGGYYCARSEVKSLHYTSVSYLAKFLTDTAKLEETAVFDREHFRQAAVRHRTSADRAVENLASLDGNFETEGEQTFEDGMISCSMLQLAYKALETKDEVKREELTRCAEALHESHRCLSMTLAPDCRCNSATIRFWEAQYNCNIFSDMLCSPCGWTAWQLYGTWYLYLLTGKMTYLRETMNGIGACMQLADGETGELRWGYIVDPYIETKRYVRNTQNEGQGMLVDDVISEQYVELISGWHNSEPFPRKKFGIDNLTYEVFKCMCETSLENACVFLNENNQLEGYNCTVQQQEDIIMVVPFEGFVKRVHCNFNTPRKVMIKFADKTVEAMMQFGMVNESRAMQ